MSDKEFKPFSKIERIGKLEMSITQKIHGTNAQVFIYKDANGELDLLVGSRTRWITPENDNYGFASFVYGNKQEFIDKLGIGTHFGEWAGPGINSGEGLTEKTFILFDFYKYPDARPLPPKTKVVPLLYRGKLDFLQIDKCSNRLLIEGSALVPGFMRPEGVVIIIGGIRYKRVFETEESKWQGGDGTKDKLDKIKNLNYGYLLQPIRLEKLLSRDEIYTREYPKSLPNIVRDYFQDLVSESQVSGTDDEIKAVRRGCSSDIFNFVKKIMEEKQ